jgi:hypothetical protein
MSPFDRAWRDLLHAMRNLQAYSSGPVIPGRPINIVIETSHLYTAADRLCRILREERTMIEKKAVIDGRMVVCKVTLTFHAENPAEVDRTRQAFIDYLEMGEQLRLQAQRILQGVGGAVAGVTVKMEER